MRICIVDNTDAEVKASVALFFGEREKTRVDAIKNARYKRESCAGLLALHRTLQKEPACEIIEIEREDGGRPHFPPNVKADFNISHSGSLSAAALLLFDEGKVGIDIERVASCGNNDKKAEERLLRIAERYFTSKEKALLESERSADMFYKIWTAKEAEAKYSGAGLSKIFSDKAREQSWEGNSLFENKELIFSSFEITFKNDRYILTVCTAQKVTAEFICDGCISVSPLN